MLLRQPVCEKAGERRFTVTATISFEIDTFHPIAQPDVCSVVNLSRSYEVVNDLSPAMAGATKRESPGKEQAPSTSDLDEASASSPASDPTRHSDNVVGR